MEDSTAKLSRTITWAGSKQSFFTFRILIDKALVADAYRAYAYFRWLDDFVDSPSPSDSERTSFIQRQRNLVDRLYMGEQPTALCPEEEIAVVLISHDSGENKGLRSYIRNMMDIIAFDVSRRDRLISEQELIWYSDHLGKAVVDCIQYFIGNEYPYPQEQVRYQIAIAAHITHLLRDMQYDISNGLINIPKEYLQTNNIGPKDVNSEPFKQWVRQRVALARNLFDEGKAYLDTVDVLRYKVAGYWYAKRFEVILDAIERDDYVLRYSYDNHRQLLAWAKIPFSGVVPALRKFTRR